MWRQRKGDSRFTDCAKEPAQQTLLGRSLLDRDTTENSTAHVNTACCVGYRQKNELMPTSRAALVFALIQPIISFVCGVVVILAVVVSLTPFFSSLELIGGKTVLPMLDNRRSKCQGSRHAITLTKWAILDWLTADQHHNVIFSQIIFEATRGRGFASDIALDDIKITSGRCPKKQPNPGSFAKLDWGALFCHQCI